MIYRSSVISVSSEAADMTEQKQHNSQTVSVAADKDKSSRNTFKSPHAGCLKADNIKMVDTEVRQTQLSNSSPDPASTICSNWF